jgi:hypothetical protein
MLMEEKWNTTEYIALKLPSHKPKMAVWCV